MSLDSVRAFLAEKAPDIAIIELETSTATVALAAEVGEHQRRWLADAIEVDHGGVAGGGGAGPREGP